MPLKERVVETAKAEAAGVTALANQAISSKAYLYPIRGLFYFLSHKNLWKPLTSRLAPLTTLSVGVVSSMFLFTYIPQSILLTFVNGPLAFISTIALVLSESAAIISALSKTFLIDEALVDLFDAVLLQEDCIHLVSQGRELKSGSGIERLGKTLKKPFAKFTPQEIISYFLWLPLNFIPVVGTAIFIFVQGRKQGPSYHSRYLQLKGMSQREIDAFVEERKPAYIAFGTVAMLLQLVPLANVLFMYTSTAGAALWAVDMEKGRQAGEATDPNESQVKTGNEVKKEL